MDKIGWGTESTILTNVGLNYHPRTNIRPQVSLFHRKSRL